MISLSDLSIWCYSCDAYVEHPKLITLRAQMETLKFGGQGDALRRKPVMSSYDLEGIASYIAERQVRKIVVMCGAGISTAAGIPDFRTPGSGLYDNLRKFQLSKPEDMFTVDFFMQNPEPFYTLCQEMWPGKHHPTLTHFFILLLEKKGLLLRCYTQNIDSLETSAGLPAEKLVAAHGSFDGAHVCKRPARFSSFRICEPIEQADVEVPVEEMRSAVEKGADGWRALNVKFGGLCKPKIVFFGEDLPASFELCEKDFPECDLLLVMGTSLVVHPFAGLVSNVGEDTPRLLLNREPAGLAGLHGLPGGFQFHLAEQNYRDAFHAGDCDSGCRALAKLLGWEAELLALVETRGAADVQTVFLIAVLAGLERNLTNSSMYKIGASLKTALHGFNVIFTFFAAALCGVDQLGRKCLLSCGCGDNLLLTAALVLVSGGGVVTAICENNWGAAGLGIALQLASSVAYAAKFTAVKLLLGKGDARAVSDPAELPPSKLQSGEDVSDVLCVYMPVFLACYSIAFVVNPITGLMALAFLPFFETSWQAWPARGR
ncbi:unnamed protein product [Polarella glacialis]|uniref:Protein acetyllysine N-acetyltransferase n=1 Tax=Polarella glacialis TaxID=89957 RepID=A0A813HX26_POLGL|nr:unnamed protein product [Polarella glacialis]